MNDGQGGYVSTLSYMSPELLKDSLPSKESDVYAFAILIFEGVSSHSCYPPKSHTLHPVPPFIRNLKSWFM